MNMTKNIVLLTLTVLGMFTFLSSCQQEKEDGKLLYHSKTVDITPEEPVLLAGFANRQGLSDTVHHGLLSKCVVLQYDTTKICLIANDLMEIAPEYADEIRQRISEATGFPTANIILTVSHTHSAPIMDGMGLGWHEANETYKKKVIGLIADNAIETLKDTTASVQASVRLGKGLSTISTSRRALDPETGETAIGESDAAVDQEVKVLQFQDDEGQPLSTWFNYACHPVVLGFPSRAVSSDFVGEARTVVANKWGGDTLFLNGAAGDINPKHGLSKSLKLADSIGAELGNAVVQISLEKDQEIPTMKYISSHIELPYRDQNMTLAFIDEQVALKSAQKTEFVHWADDVRKWGELMKTKLQEKGSLPNHRQVEIAVLRIGSSVVVFAQGEYFNSYQARLKKKFPQVNLVFAGYSHGESGYIPDGASFAARGYEVDQAYIYIHEPSPLTSAAEQVVMDGIQELIGRVL